MQKKRELHVEQIQRLTKEKHQQQQQTKKFIDRIHAMFGTHNDFIHSENAIATGAK